VGTILRGKFAVVLQIEITLQNLSNVARPEKSGRLQGARFPKIPRNYHGAWANIPPRSNRTEPISFSPYLYRARNLVERFFNKIKHCRRVATRYDKLAANYLAFVQLASIRLWLRVNEFTS
jgi:Transposase DDE domain